MSARERTRCHYCRAEFQMQDGYRLFWTGNDGHAYCSPEHAIKYGGDPEKVKTRKEHVRHQTRRHS